jgi:hypothetical protein
LCPVIRISADRDTPVALDSQANASSPMLSVLQRHLLDNRIALPISDEPLTSYAKELQLPHLWRSRRLDLTRAGHSRRTRFYGRLLLCSGRCGRPEFSPTVALESHTIGVFQGAMLFGLAAVWPSLGSGWAVKIAQYCALLGFYANRKFKARRDSEAVRGFAPILCNRWRSFRRE